MKVPAWRLHFCDKRLARRNRSSDTVAVLAPAGNAIEITLQLYAMPVPRSWAGEVIMNIDVGQLVLHQQQQGPHLAGALAENALAFPFCHCDSVVHLTDVQVQLAPISRFLDFFFPGQNIDAHHQARHSGPRIVRHVCVRKRCKLVSEVILSHDVEQQMAMEEPVPGMLWNPCYRAGSCPKLLCYLIPLL